jgi:hypothetical protein
MEYPIGYQKADGRFFAPSSSLAWLGFPLMHEDISVAKQNL